MYKSITLADIPEVCRLPETLWGVPPGARRSAELTCLYVQRYSGVRPAMPLGVHPFAELIYVFGGSGTLLTPAPISLKAGTAVLLSKNQPHIEQSSDGLDMLWVGLRGTRVRDRCGLRATANVEMHPLLEAIWLLGQRRYGKCGPELDGLCTQALGRLERLADEADAPAAEIELVDRACHYLRRHYARPITVAQLAVELGVSEGHLHRRFRARTGKTPVAYLTDLRLAAALDMLQHSNLPIARIARLNGFGDPLYFSRLCRHHTGRPPSAWRAGR